MTDTPDKSPIDLSNFNAQAVIDYFDFLEKTPHEEQALRYLHACLNFQFENSRHKGPAEHAQMVNHVTIDKVKLRYELYKLHADFFFEKDYVVDHAALSIAVICGEYTGHINEQLQGPEPPEGWDHDNDNFKFRDDGFTDQEAVQNAYMIWEAVTTLEGEGLPDDTPLPLPEIVFLAHINMMQTIHEIDVGFQDYTQEQLQDILAIDFRTARDYILPFTSLGVALQEYIDQMEQRILQVLVIKPHELPDRGLRIITPEGPQPLQ